MTATKHCVRCHEDVPYYDVTEYTFGPDAGYLCYHCASKVVEVLYEDIQDACHECLSKLIEE